jgi:hypothetical protein
MIRRRARYAGLALLWHIFERFGVFGIPELRLA